MASSQGHDVLELTQALLRLDTVNPPGNESAACDLLEPLLAQLGFQTARYPLAPGRDNLVAYPPAAQSKLLCFTGHLDTVPLGLAPWTRSPLEGQVVDGKVYGRGSSDMKGGIAAFVCAAARTRVAMGTVPPVVLVLTAGEETGCEGARVLGPVKELGLPVRALLVGEPTANRLVIGHKGALWLKATALGTTAHGSMPERGDNAIYKAAQAIERVRQFVVQPQWSELLGRSTLNVGTVRGGLNINSVPDRAEFEIDIRTVGRSAQLSEDLQAYLGNKVRLRAQLDVPSLQTDPAHPWIRAVARAMSEVQGAEPEPAAVSFFTDGPVLREIWGDIPTAIVGPGDPGCAHATDEYCQVDALHDAVRIYEKIIHSHSCN